MTLFKRLDDFFKTPNGVVTLCFGLLALIVWTFAPALQCDFLYFDDAAIEPKNSWNYNGLASCFLQLGRAGDAVAPVLKAAELAPNDALYTDHLNTVLSASGHETEAISNFLAIVRSDPGDFSKYLDVLLLDTNRVDLMNNLAWAFATNPDPKLRNGQFAIRLAKRACEITGHQITVCVGTLAAAYADDSRFDEAVSTAQPACSLATSAGDKDLLKKNEELLELFRSHKPYHEAVQTTSNQTP